MTTAQRKTLEAYAGGDLPLNRAIRAALSRIDELERTVAERDRRLADEARRTLLARTRPEGAEGRAR